MHLPKPIPLIGPVPVHGEPQQRPHARDDGPDGEDEDVHARQDESNLPGCEARELGVDGALGEGEGGLRGGVGEDARDEGGGVGGDGGGEVAGTEGQDGQEEGF